MLFSNRLFFTIASLLLSTVLMAQAPINRVPKDSIAIQPIRKISPIPYLAVYRPQIQLKFSGYVDVNYARSSEENSSRGTTFPSIGAEAGRFGLSIAQLSMDARSENVRGKMTLHYGELPNNVYRQRLSAIQEAFAGVKLRKKLWLEVGTFRSHLGTETILPKDNVLSKVAINSYLEPVIQTGARLDWRPFNRWNFNFYLLNGFGNVQAHEKSLSPGLKVIYNTFKRWKFVYSNQFIQRTEHKNLFYHNLWAQFRTSRTYIKAGYSFGFQNNSPIGNEVFPEAWFEPETSYTQGFILSGQYLLSNRWAISGRIEHLNDVGGLISPGHQWLDQFNPRGLLLNGLGLGATYRPNNFAYCRLEARTLSSGGSGHDIFDRRITDTGWRGSLYRNEVLATIGIWFGDR